MESDDSLSEIPYSGPQQVGTASRFSRGPSPRVSHSGTTSPQSEPLSDSGEVNLIASALRDLRKEKHNAAAKISIFCQLLRTWNWTFKQFIEAWTGIKKRSGNFEVKYPRYQTAQMRRKVLSDALHDGIFRGIEGEQPYTAGGLMEELNALIHEGATYFGPGPLTIDEVGELEIRAAFNCMAKHAPGWTSLLRTLLQNQRNHLSSYRSQTAVKVAEPIRKRKRGRPSGRQVELAYPVSDETDTDNNGDDQDWVDEREGGEEGDGEQPRTTSGKPKKKDLLKKREALLQRRIVVVTAVICHTRARSDSSWFATSIGYYLATNGVSRQVLQVLQSFV
ncbi:hypothetical protein C1H76_8169 [Elsinoe australis]|uniref:Uncharacterized protein n=1 Tax=Elsinoe australis TaxID=40998 RepID=A0A4U7ANG6_9PEZI|nr:hypothetical protein C1H76_8169 [Elsinoe australis]